MPISEEKTVVLHYSKHQPRNFYSLNGQPISAVNRHANLGVKMT